MSFVFKVDMAIRYSVGGIVAGSCAASPTASTAACGPRPGSGPTGLMVHRRNVARERRHEWHGFRDGGT